MRSASRAADHVGCTMPGKHALACTHAATSMHAHATQTGNAVPGSRNPRAQYSPEPQQENPSGAYQSQTGGRAHPTTRHIAAQHAMLSAAYG